MSTCLITIILAFYCILKLYECCPTGYTQCAVKDGQCSLSNSNVIAYGADGFRWAYKTITGTFSCGGTELNFDPVDGIDKECCYQNPAMTGIPSAWTWSAGDIVCNERIYAYVSTSSEEHIWKLTTTTTRTVTFNNCDSGVSDTQLTLYNSAGNSVMSSTQYSCYGCFGLCTTTCNGCDGDDCGLECSSSRHEQFTYPSLPAATYYIRFSPYSGSGNYQLTVSCSGAPNHIYGTNVLTCQDNTISKVTSDANRYQFFQINTNSKHDITFETCGTAWDTTLYVYDDSLYSSSHQLIGGDNDACSSGTGFQESYVVNGLDPGNYYVKIGYADQCGNSCSGNYQFSVTCTGNHPSAAPTPTPTGITSAPTTSQPSVNPSISPTNNPTKSPTMNPTSIPTKSPTKSPTLSPTQRPTERPSKRPSVPPSTGADGVIDIVTSSDTGGNKNNNKGGTLEQSETGNSSQDTYVIILAILLALSVCCCIFIVAVYFWKKRKDNDKKNIFGERDIEMQGIEGAAVTTDNNNTDGPPGTVPMTANTDNEMQYITSVGSASPMSQDNAQSIGNGFNRINSTSQIGTGSFPPLSMAEMQQQMMQMQQQMNMPLSMNTQNNLNHIWSQYDGANMMMNNNHSAPGTSGNNVMNGNDIVNNNNVKVDEGIYDNNNANNANNEYDSDESENEKNYGALYGKDKGFETSGK